MVIDSPVPMMVYHRPLPSANEKPHIGAVGSVVAVDKLSVRT